MHFFNPPHRNPLVEVIRTPATDDATAATLSRIVAALDKIGVPAGIGDGFVANRVYADYRTQAEFLVEEGASPSDVDARDARTRHADRPLRRRRHVRVGHRLGAPEAAGRDARSAATLCRDPRPALRSGPAGQKTGAGWYTYPDRLAPRGTRSRSRGDHRGRTGKQGNRAAPDRRCGDPRPGAGLDAVRRRGPGGIRNRRARLATSMCA